MIESRNLARGEDQQRMELQKFWGRVAYSCGTFWGVANLVYSPIAALTSIAGSSWPEVFVVSAGGLLTLFGSVGAFYRRASAARAMLAGGLLLLGLGAASQLSGGKAAYGAANLGLLFLAGAVPAILGIFGLVTTRKGWPALR